MVNYCCVPRCRSKAIKGSGIRFHHIPKDENLRNQWKIAIGCTGVSMHSFVCGLHFTESDYQTNIYRKGPGAKLKVGTVPSRNIMPREISRQDVILESSSKRIKGHTTGHCGVSQCKTKRTIDTPLFRIPKSIRLNPMLLNKWSIILRMENAFPNNFLICANHFDPKAILKPASKHVNIHPMLLKSAIPCRNLPILKTSSDNWNPEKSEQFKQPRPSDKGKGFPKCNIRKSKWLELINQEKPMSINAFICSIHFEKECFMLQNPNSRRRKLRKSAVPTLFTDHSEIRFDTITNIENLSYSVITKENLDHCSSDICSPLLTPESQELCYFLDSDILPNYCRYDIGANCEVFYTQMLTC